MVKMADSAMMRQAMPTLPREGRVHATSGRSVGSTIGAAKVLIRSLRLLVAAIRIFRMLQIPQRPTTRDGWDFGKVVGRRRRTDRPFERPRVPGIVAGFLALPVRDDQIPDE